MMEWLAIALVAALADGDQAAARGDHEAAARYFRAEVAVDPASYEARFKLARVLSFSGRREEAIRLYSELLAESPENSDVLIGRGRTYAWEGRWAEAEQDLQRVTARQPAYGDAWSALGDVYLWSDRPADAVRAYSGWVTADPEDHRPLLARARAHRAAGSVAAAKADLEAARTRGAPAPVVDEQLRSLAQRRQEPEAAAPEGFRWLANLSVGQSEFSPVTGSWTYGSLALRHYRTTSSIALEYLISRRFSLNDAALALDAYVDLWPRAYVNLRLQYAPRALLFPDDAYRAELFQGVGKGWELSASYDHMDFGSGNVDLYGAGLGKYVGDWYFRWRVLMVPAPARTGISQRVLGRYYYAGNGDDYGELSAGYGEGGRTFSGTDIVEKTRSHSFGAAFQRYLDPRWGVKITAGYGEDSVYPYRERSATLNIMRRW